MVLEAKDDTLVPASTNVDKEMFGTRVVHFPIYIYFGPGLKAIDFLRQALPCSGSLALSTKRGLLRALERALSEPVSRLVRRGMTPLLVKEPVYDSLGIQLMSSLLEINPKTGKRSSPRPVEQLRWLHEHVHADPHLPGLRLVSE